MLLMLLFIVLDDNMYGGVGVRPTVLKQCDNYQSHQPKRLRAANVDGINDICKQK